MNGCSVGLFLRMEICLSIATLIFPGAAQAAETIGIVIPAAKDNTLFEGPTGSLGNGVDAHLYVGRTFQRSIRRTLTNPLLSSPSITPIPGGPSSLASSEVEREVLMA